MSFSLAFPNIKKFLVRTLTHVSFAATGVCWEITMSRQRLSAREKAMRFITNTQGPKMEELASRKAYSTVTH